MIKLINNKLVFNVSGFIGENIVNELLDNKLSPYALIRYISVSND